MPLRFRTLAALGLRRLLSAVLAAADVTSFPEVNAHIATYEVERPGVTNRVTVHHRTAHSEHTVLSNEARLNPEPSASERFEARLDEKGVSNLARKAATRATRQHLRGEVYTPTKGRWLPNGRFMDESDEHWGAEFQPPRIPGTNRTALREAIRTAPRELRMGAWAGGRSHNILRDIRAAKARVPDRALLGSAAKLEPPSAEEGFDALFRVYEQDDAQRIEALYDPEGAGLLPDSEP